MWRRGSRLGGRFVRRPSETIYGAFRIAFRFLRRLRRAAHWPVEMSTIRHDCCLGTLLAAMAQALMLAVRWYRFVYWRLPGALGRIVRRRHRPAGRRVGAEGGSTGRSGG